MARTRWPVPPGIIDDDRYCYGPGPYSTGTRQTSHAASLLEGLGAEVPVGHNYNARWTRGRGACITIMLSGLGAEVAQRYGHVYRHMDGHVSRHVYRHLYSSALNAALLERRRS